jgi:hypothetical protein
MGIMKAMLSLIFPLSIITLGYFIPGGTGFWVMGIGLGISIGYHLSKIKTLP